MVSALSGQMPAQLLDRVVQSSYDRQFAAYQKQPLVARSATYFRENIGKVESVDALLDDYRLKTDLLEAFGLEELGNSRALIKRILADDLTSEDALVYRMNDPRFVQMATTLQLDTGTDRLKDPALVESIVARQQTNGFEKQVGEQSLAVRQAMYFRRNAGTGKIENMYQILGDKVLRDVALKAAGLPKEVANVPLEKQAAMLAKQLDLTKLDDPAYMERFIQKYLTKEDMANSDGGAGILSLFQPLGASGGINFLV